MATFTPGYNFVDGVANGCSAAALNAQIADAVPLAGLVSNRTARATTATTDKVLVEAGGALYYSTLANLIPAYSLGADKLAVDGAYLGYSFRIRANVSSNGWVWMPGASNALVLQQTNPDGTPLTSYKIPIQVAEAAENNTLYLNGTGVGILNSSPAYALDVTGTARASKVIVRGAAAMLAFTDTTDPYYGGFFMDAGYLFFGKLASEGGASATGYTPFAIAVNAVDNLLRVEAAGVTMAGTLGVTGATTLSGALTLAGGTAPASATAAGTAGEIRWAESGGTAYVYICVATNTWRRAALVGGW